jgi:alpha-galactosidase
MQKLRVGRLAALVGLTAAALTLGLAHAASARAAASSGQSSAQFDLADLRVEVDADLGPFELTVTTRSPRPGVEIATMRLSSATDAPPPRLTLRWSLPARDVHGQWNTGARFEKGIDADWGPSRVRSMLARNAPVMALFGADDGNRLTFAVSDALNAVDLTAGVREENA